MSGASLEAATLAKILLIQSVVGQFDRDDDALGFVCHGLEELPGVSRVRHLPPTASRAGQPESADIRQFPLALASHHHGYLELALSDPQAFDLCASHVTNLCFMVALSLEERRQRRLNEEQQQTLERRVAERTQWLSDEIAERRAAQRAADMERCRAERYLEVSEAIIVELDERACVLTINERGAEMVGYPAAELVGRDWIDLAIPEDQRTTVRQLFERIISGRAKATDYAENYVVNRSGERRLIAWRNVLRRENGVVVGTLSSGVDVTEHRRLLENAHHAEKLKSLGILAGGIAHDFNNLLGGIFGLIELARDAAESGSEVRAHLDEALRVHGRAKSLTQQLLTFSKGGEPVFQTSSVARVLADSVSFALMGSSVTVAFDLPRELWLCEFDPNQLGRVFDNLAVNAVQAMPQGGRVEVRARNVSVAEGDPALAAGEYVQISVADNGPGIPQDVLKSVFDPFFTTKSGGSGLGLAASYSIIQRHRGVITMESSPGAGATFHVWLPAMHDAQPRESQRHRAPDSKGLVLVMDDEDFMRRTMRHMLTRLGYEVIDVPDGEAALTASRQARSAGRQIELIILDLTIRGGLGGKSVVRELAEHWPTVPVFAMSGYNEDPVMSAPEEYGFTAALPKPFLLADIRDLFERHRSSGSP